MALRSNNVLRNTADYLTDRLPIFLGVGAAAVTFAVGNAQAEANNVTGGTPFSVPHPSTPNKAALNRAVQRDMNRLAKEALLFKSVSHPGEVNIGSAINITREGDIEVVTETVPAPSLYGSDRGEYYISFLADASLKGNVHKIMIAEGINKPNGQIDPYTLDYGEMNNRGGAVASITHDFNLNKANQSEAAVGTRDHEQQLTFAELNSWNNQAEGIIKSAEIGTATRDLPLAFKELAHNIIYAL